MDTEQLDSLTKGSLGIVLIALLGLVLLLVIAGLLHARSRAAKRRQRLEAMRQQRDPNVEVDLWQTAASRLDDEGKPMRRPHPEEIEQAQLAAEREDNEPGNADNRGDDDSAPWENRDDGGIKDSDEDDEDDDDDEPWKRGIPPVQ